MSIAHDAIGVDAELLDRPCETVDIADRYFSRLESRALRSLPPAPSVEPRQVPLL